MVGPKKSREASADSILGQCGGQGELGCGKCADISRDKRWLFPCYETLLIMQ